MKDTLDECLDLVTVDMLEELERGEEIALDKEYSLYRYFTEEEVDEEGELVDNEHYVIKDSEEEEIFCVQWNTIKRKDIVFTGL
jgi:hypothetical protein